MFSFPSQGHGLKNNEKKILYCYAHKVLSRYSKVSYKRSQIDCEGVSSFSLKTRQVIGRWKAIMKVVPDCTSKKDERANILVHFCISKIHWIGREWVETLVQQGCGKGNRHSYYSISFVTTWCAPRIFIVPGHHLWVSVTPYKIFFYIDLSTNKASLF